MKRYEQDLIGQVRKGIKHRKISPRNEEIRQYQQENMELAKCDDD